MIEDYCQRIEKYEDKEVVFKEGDDLGGAVYLVLAGKVRLTKKVGRKQVVVDVVEEGEGLGDVELLGEGDNNACVTAQALGDAEICLLDTQEITHLAERLSPLFRKMITTLCSRFRNTSALLVDFTLEEAEAKK